ncbi:MAG TPA: glycoside hydrolase family 2 TIM barrel-domain containing protein [Candidatus Lokiarchaeia archaeon]|nr:glycoside hydrolase family 2 TIM barrel-domain containing protein [Candidatus Lokiarchaeia archaeon]
MRTEISLDGIWQVWIDRANEYPSMIGPEFEAQLPDFLTRVEWQKCSVPSVWNVAEKSLMRFFGSAFYRTTFTCPAHAENSTIQLYFGGVNYQCVAWVNGHFVGEHQSGYTSFTLDVSHAVYSDLENYNELVVYANNAWEHEDRLPWVHTVDWFNYGGIHRSVTLVIVPPARIANFTLQDTVDFGGKDGEVPNSIQLQAAVELGNNSLADFSGSLTIEVWDWSRKIRIASAEDQVSMGSMQSASVALVVDMGDNVQLWGPDRPTLYWLVFRLWGPDDQLCDEREWKWGFKTLEIRGPQFYLNNRPFILKGTNRHEDHPSFGLALPPSLHLFDLQKMKDANINCFRGAHHANDEAVLDLCDELGLFFVEEVPAYNLIPADLRNPVILETAQRMFAEMHERDKNHACIFAWSLANEIHSEAPEGRQFLESCFAFARNLDPHRFLIYVSNKHLTDICYDLTDFLCVNIYDGWYSNRMEDFVHVIQTLREIMLDEDRPFGSEKPIILSEFGAEGLAGYRSWDGAKWSEDYQAELLHFYIQKCKELGFIAGTWTWLFIDFRVDLPQRPDGRPRSYNNKGILNEFRLPKLAYDAVKKLYSEWT